MHLSAVSPETEGEKAMTDQQEPLDFMFGYPDEWTANLMFKAMLADVLRRVRRRGGLRSEAEQARILKSGTEIERRELFMEELALTLAEGWDKDRILAVFKKHRKKS